MEKILKVSSSDSQGFTLIELLIVVAVIGILASVVLMSFVNSRTKSKVTAFKSQVHSMQVFAVSTCDGAVLDASNVVSPLSGVSYVGTITFGPQNCAGMGLSGGTFSFTVGSTGITPPCTAIVRDTGVSVSCL